MVAVTLILAALTVSAEPTAGDLVGKVVDSAGKPIPAATVFIYTAKPRIGPGILCPSCYGDCGKKAVSDGTGKFEISGLNPGLLFKVLVVAEGFQPRFAKDIDPWEGPLDVRLEKMPDDLSGRTVLRGLVLDPDGKPVVGAVVEPEGCERADRRWWGRMPGVDAACVTNLRGEFLITGNPGDLGYDVDVEVPGFVKCRTELLPTGKKVHEIRLCVGAIVQGRIVQKGKPVVGIAVGLVQCDRGHRKFVGVYRIATDKDGQFTFVNVRPNDDYYVFTTMGDAARRGAILLPQQISVGDDLSTKKVGDLDLASAVHRVAGCIILTDGKAISAGTSLLLSREGAWDSQSSTVAVDGSFSFAGVPEEAVTLIARISGYRLAGKLNRFQQIRPSTVAMFVDTDKSGLELHFEPVAAKLPAKTSK